MSSSQNFSLDRPTALPRISRLKSQNKESLKLRDSLKHRKNQRSERGTKKKRNLLKESAERFISEECEKARKMDYKGKALFLNKLADMISNTTLESLNEPLFFELVCNEMLLFIKDDYSAIRAMCFRIMRLCLFIEKNLIFMLVSHVDIYVVRGLDLRVENDVERAEALQIIAAMIYVYETSNYKKLIEDSAAKQNGKKYAFPKSIMQPVISVALSAINRVRGRDKHPNNDNDDNMTTDKLALPCVSLFLEFCIYEPQHILEMAGTDWMVRVLTGTAAVSRRLAVLVGRVLVFWLDDPNLRMKAQLHLVLEQIFAPLIEFGFFQKNPASEEFGEQAVENAMDNFSSSFLVILRSWAGMFSCSAVGPSSTVIASSPLRLLEYLGLGTVSNANLAKIRDVIVDICCDFMDMPYAKIKFTSWKQALEFYGSMMTPDSFKSSIKEDFVLAHSDIIIANDKAFADHVDLLTSFRALAFFILVNAGLPQSLSRLIMAQPDSPSSLKAMLLLSDMLRVTPGTVPSGWRAAILSLPTLVHAACEEFASCRGAAAVHGYNIDDITEQNTFVNAKNAELVLHRFDVLNRAWVRNAIGRPALDSHYALFLQLPNHNKANGDAENAPPAYRKQLSDQRITSLLDTSLSHQNDSQWLSSACLLMTTINNDQDALLRLSADKLVDLLEKVLNYISPSQRSEYTSTWRCDRLPIVVGKLVVYVAMKLSSKQLQVEIHLTKFALDFRSALDTNNLHRTIYSPKNLEQLGSMYHLVIIGAMSSHEIGLKVLEKTGIFQILRELMRDATAKELVKVIVSSLDHTRNCVPGAMPHIILQAALTSTNESSRSWCTRFVGLLASLRLRDFEDWGIRLLVGQLADSSRKVVRHAIRTLHQWIPVYPNAASMLQFVQTDVLGEAGIFLKAQSYGVESVVERDFDRASEEVRYWMETFNARYLETIDDDMRVTLLSIKRSMGGGFSRDSGERMERHGLRAPVHLLGVMASHSMGRKILRMKCVVPELVRIMSEETDVVVLKGAVLALGNIGSTEQGYTLLPTEAVPLMVRLAEESTTLSLRGVAYWALCILSSSAAGARALAQVGWECNRHRHVLEAVRNEMDRGDLPESSVRKSTLLPVTEDYGFQITVDRVRHVRGMSIPAMEIMSERIVKPARERSSSDAFLPQLTPLSASTLRRSHSDVCLSPLSSAVSHSDQDRLAESIREDRALTADSSWAMGLSSQSDDVSSLSVPTANQSRRRTTTSASLADEWEARSRTSTVARCLRDGLSSNRRDLETAAEVADLVREPHFSSRWRERWRLAPLRTRRVLQVNRNAGDPVRYVYMTKEEESSLANYRRLAYEDDWMYTELQRVRVDAGTLPTGLGVQFMHVMHTLALPAEVDIICGSIFSSRGCGIVGRWETAGGVSGVGGSGVGECVEDRGAKSGHGRSQRTDAHLSHSSYRCFYCSAEKKEPFVLPTNVDILVLRRQVLHHVDMLEVKENTPEAKLISLRRQHPWLFEWPCLYADVLELLDEYRFKATSRAFLQEIFYEALKI